MDLLRVSGVCKRERDFSLKNIHFTQKQFQKIAIAGETGSGKTTLLKIIAGLISADEGEVYFENERIKKMPEEKLVPGHAGIAYVSQHFELPQHLTVEQVLIYANVLPDDMAEKDEAAKHLYELCNISHLLKRKTSQLSGGEKQRIALAKLLIAKPRLLVLDEPFSNLDMIHKTILKKVINDVAEELGITCMMVSHDPLDTISWADEILVMYNGEIIQKDTPYHIYHHPVNEYTAGLFGKYNLLSKAAATGIATVTASKKYVLLRPEKFIITNQPKNTVAGKIDKLVFFGSYYELQVALENTTVLVRTTITTFSPGDIIYLSVSADDVYLL